MMFDATTIIVSVAWMGGSICTAAWFLGRKWIAAAVLIFWPLIGAIVAHVLLPHT
jgi:hypothetical protein